MEIGWIEVCLQFNFSIPFSCYLEYVGMPFEDILSNLSIDKELHPAIKHLYGISVIQNHHHIKLYRGIKSLLKQLTKSDKAIGIVTSKEFWRAEIIIDHFQLPSNILITPEHVLNGKPNPEPILKAMANLGVSRQETLYIGDMQSDCEAALSAKVDYIHCNWGYGKSIPGIPCISYPEELLDIVI